MSLSTDLILALYPLHQSYQSLKKPRNAESVHWNTFWQVWVSLHLLDQIINRVQGIWTWIPLSSIVMSIYVLGRSGIIIANYDSRVTYATKKTVLSFIYKEGKKFSNQTCKQTYITDYLWKTYNKSKDTNNSYWFSLMFPEK